MLMDFTQKIQNYLKTAKLIKKVNNLNKDTDIENYRYKRCEVNYGKWWNED